jgi:hypothetical protein
MNFTKVELLKKRNKKFQKIKIIFGTKSSKFK